MFGRKKGVSALNFMSHNVRGGGGLKLLELTSTCRGLVNLGVVMLQELWNSKGDAAEWPVIEENGYFLLQNGKDKKTNKKGRNSGGVGLLLSAEMYEGFLKAGGDVLRFGERIIAARIKVMTTRNSKKCRKRRRGAKFRATKTLKRKEKTLFVVSSYAPTSCRKNDEERQQFYEDFEKCVKECGKNETLIIGGDFNASMGVRRDKDCKVLGPHGVRTVTNSGNDVYGLLASLQLCAPATFFDKKTHTTWVHPNYKNGYQLDHFIMRRKDFRKITDVGIKATSVDSDHNPLFLTLDTAVVRKGKSEKDPKFNRKYLKTDENKMEFNNDVEEIRRRENAKMETIEDIIGSFNSSIKEVQDELTGKSEGRNFNWIGEIDSELKLLVSIRNEHRYRVACDPSDKKNVERLKQSRRNVRLCLRKGKLDKLKELQDDLNDRSFGSLIKSDNRAYWSLVRNYLGFGETKTVKPFMNINKPDGSPCKDQKETAQTFRNHFNKVYNFSRPTPEWEKTLENVDQKPLETSLAALPEIEEIARIIKKMQNGKATGDNGVCVESYKALFMMQTIRDEDGKKIGEDFSDSAKEFASSIQDFWRDLKYEPKDWKLGNLKILYKKGSTKDPNNYRGIMLLDISSKIVSALIADRLLDYMKKIGLDEQSGFTKEKGCQNGYAALMSLLRKRREHNSDTWVLFVDLVKAFDTVNRSHLMDILAKLGVPLHLIEIIKIMHTDQKVSFSVDEEKGEFASNVGVKQGDNLAPVLFVMFMQVVMEEMRKKWPDDAFLKYRSKEDGVLTGRDINYIGKGVGEWDFFASLYADDAAMPFNSRESMIEGADIIFSTFKEFGMEMHIGRNGKKSKTEALFCPAGYKDRPGPHWPNGYSNRQGDAYSKANLSPIPCDGDGCIHFTPNFKYLGSFISWDLDDTLEIESRIRKAKAGFGAMNCIFLARAISLETKKQLFLVLVCSILLYGSENWCISRESERKLNVFWNCCVRQMTGVNRHESRHKRISADDLEQRMGLLDFKSYLGLRALNWYGKIARMDYRHNQIRRLLTGWIQNPRKVGCPRLTFGRSIISRYFKRILSHPSIIELPTVEEAFVNSFALYEGQKSDSSFISWIDLAKDEETWNMVSQLVRNDVVNFDVTLLEETAKKIKEKIFDSLCATALTQADSDLAEKSRISIPTTFPTLPPFPQEPKNPASVSSRGRRRKPTQEVIEGYENALWEFGVSLEAAREKRAILIDNWWAREQKRKKRLKNLIESQRKKLQCNNNRVCKLQVRKSQRLYDFRKKNASKLRKIHPRIIVNSRSAAETMGPLAGIAISTEADLSQAIIIFTDGAASDNGKPNAKAGIGVYFGDDHLYNVSRPVSFLPPTNNVAELEAILVALQKAESEIEKGKSVVIKTDSQYAMQIFTVNISFYRANNWKKRGKILKNTELIKLIDEFIVKYHESIYFYKVAAHKVAPIQQEDPSGYDDWLGNDHADKLAVEGRLQITDDDPNIMAQDPILEQQPLPVSIGAIIAGTL